MAIITIKHVGIEKQTKGKGSWEVAEVIYSDERGQTSTKKIMSFANPQVFAAFKDANPGDKYDVQLSKNDAGYWNFTSAAKSDGTSSTAPQTSQGNPPPRAGGQVNSFQRDFETKEERAIRQRLIVRQSSLSAAVSSLGAGPKSPVNPDEVLALADRFTDWVFTEPSFLEDNASAN
jgi:hypothetical protein